MPRRGRVSPAIFVVAAAVTMFLSDLLWDAFNREAAQHQVATAIATEALLLAAAYLVIDRIVAKQKRPDSQASPPSRFNTCTSTRQASRRS